MDVWPPLPPQVEQEMAAQEVDRRHIPQARAILERALIGQFRAIADGLLANRVLTERAEEIPFRTWVAQYLTRHDPGEPAKWGMRPAPEGDSGPCDMATAIRRMAAVLAANHPPAIQEYRQAFYRRVREVRRVRPGELAGVTVRIYGSRVPLWQEGRINSQLARLGSDLRLYVAGSDVLRTADLMTKLGTPPKYPPVPPVFLLGVGRPCTSVFKAQLFDFDHEYSVSPYIHPDSPGLVDQCRIVFRRRFFHGIVQNHAPGSIIAEGLISPILGHEESHILDKYGFVLEGHFPAWRPVMRNDICRFAREPKTSGEIYVAFSRTFDEFDMAPQRALGLLPPNESREKLKLSDILAEMVEDELLEVTQDKKYVCHLFDEGKAWPIE